jgi:hypothetical protein
MAKKSEAAADRDKKTTENQRRTNKPSNSDVVVNIEQAVIDSVNTKKHPHIKHHDWYDLVHLAILSATFAAAVAAAVFTGWLAWRTNDLARDGGAQLISATRAWIVPTSARLDGKILLDHNQRVKVTFENVGKEAAWDVAHFRGQGPLFDVIIDGKQMPYVDVR